MKNCYVNYLFLKIALVMSGINTICFARCMKLQVTLALPSS